MVRYYCSGFDVKNIFGHGLGEMINSELLKKDNLLFIPCGQKGYDKNENRDKGDNPKEKYTDSFIRQLRNVGIEFKNNYILNPNNDKDKANEFIKDANFIIMLGGDPVSMHEMIDELNIRDSLKNYTGVMMGFSAGAMNMCKYIIITPCSNEYPDFIIKEGLNLDDLTIYPHNNTSEIEFPEYIVNGEETTTTSDLIKVAKEYGNFYLLQDMENEDSTFDVSIIKSTNGNIEYYTENNGKIWLAADDGIKLYIPKQNIK